MYFFGPITFALSQFRTKLRIVASPVARVAESATPQFQTKGEVLRGAGAAEAWNHRRAPIFFAGHHACQDPRIRRDGFRYGAVVNALALPSAFNEAEFATSIVSQVPMKRIGPTIRSLRAP
jgi:hypothetical protein